MKALLIEGFFLRIFMSITLNEGQQKAADGFFKFLFTNEKELCISGAGGTGKSFLMSYLIDKVIPQYEEMCQIMGSKPQYTSVHMTATTNKAAEVLAAYTQRPVDTIHSFLGLVVYDDFETGESILKKTNKWSIHRKEIIFIDEASMIDAELLDIIRGSTHQCKIVYVGDHCQLPPVKESECIIYTQQIPFYELTQPMRNAEVPALQKVCDLLRDSVKTGSLPKIPLVPGAIELLSDQEMESKINSMFKVSLENQRILAYTNKRVVDYNSYIRDFRGIKEPYQVGDILINSTMYKITTKNGYQNKQVNVETVVKIKELSEPTTITVNKKDGSTLDVQLATIVCNDGNKWEKVKLPLNKIHYRKLTNFYKNQKDWVNYFYLKNNFMDLRYSDASTIHKAQGSSFDTVFIDLSDLSTCTRSDMVLRLLYVGFTRARKKVFLYGNLKKAYGEILCSPK